MLFSPAITRVYFHIKLSKYTKNLVFTHKLRGENGNLRFDDDKKMAFSTMHLSDIGTNLAIAQRFLSAIQISTLNHDFDGPRYPDVNLEPACEEGVGSNFAQWTFDERQLTENIRYIHGWPFDT